MTKGDLKVTVAPAAIDAYRRDIDRSVDERGARLAITRYVVETYDARLARGQPPGNVAADGSEVWRIGPHRVQARVHVHPGAVDVSWIGRPHARWQPITTAKAEALPGNRPQAELGVLVRHQRERKDMTIATLAALAGVPADTVEALEGGRGIPDRDLRSICDVLDCDVLVRRRLR